MKTRNLSVAGLLIILALLFSLGAAAQGSQPSISVTRVVPQIAGASFDFGGSAESFVLRSIAAGGETRNASASQVDLGQPGLTFRYVKTLGEAELAYPDVATHLNGPWGIGTDGNHLWVVETAGLRALKFGSDGILVMQIGKAGFLYPQEVTLERPVDVTVDGGGNVWLVDSYANHILKFDSNGTFVAELGQAYECSGANDRFCDPAGIAFDGAGNIYVSDKGNERVQILDSSGSYLATLGQTGVPGTANDRLNKPEHLEVYGGLLYVADASNHRIQIFDVSVPTAPAYVATIGVTGAPGGDNSHLSGPAGVTVNDAYIYVADSTNCRVQIFDRATRLYLATVGTGLGSGNYQFRVPTDVAVDSAGNLYVADQANLRVQRFNSSWQHVRTYGTTGVPYVTDSAHFNGPPGVVVAADKSIYIVEYGGMRLVKLDSAGALVWAVGEPGVAGSDNAHLNFPNDVDLDLAGRVYVADSRNHRVQIFRSDGSYHGTLGSGYGTGNYEFDGVHAVAIDLAGNIYVADIGNHRVQVYNSNHVYLATLGVTGVPGADNAHLDTPYDLAVDSAGKLYVADSGNHRVQVFDASLAHVRTLGVTGECGEDFGHLCGPVAVAVDAEGQIYVGDNWGGRVQVFDAAGRYLTTLGGSWGSLSGQMRGSEGLAVDQAGNLYVADYLNHRVQVFAPGVPGWRQVNINGFGDPANEIIAGLAAFGDRLYAGTINSSGGGGQLWRNDGGDWVSVSDNGFGDPTNSGILHLLPFNGNLYAGTQNLNVSGTSYGGGIWRSADGLIWEPVVTGGLGEPDNEMVLHLGALNGRIYAGTFNSAQGAEIWRSDTGAGGTWVRVVQGGSGNPDNWAVRTFAEFDGRLFAGILNYSSGGQVWQSDDGVIWSPVMAGGFGDGARGSVPALRAYQGYLYASTAGGSGATVWRCQECDGDDWEQVVQPGFGDTATNFASGFEIYEGDLYLIVGNGVTGMEVWLTGNGVEWRQVGYAGFGDSNNRVPYGDNSTAVLRTSLYIGTWNGANGGEVFVPLKHVYLPLVVFNH